VVAFEPIPGLNYKHDYSEIFRYIAQGKLKRLATYRQLAQEDLFFLLYFGLSRVDIHDSARPKQAEFILNCIREVEENHRDTLDLWAREHYKSSILTYALPLQEIARNPEERISIFSHTRPIAKGFLRSIKLTLEGAPPLKKWFPDIFYANPKKQAPKWSEDDGLIVKRKGSPKESTIEAWGLVDGQPTSKHFTIRIYDDCVTRESVTTPEQIKKVADAYELSQSLGTDGGSKRVLGTHYHFADLYAQLKTKKTYTVRVKPATKDGTKNGEPVFLSHRRLEELRQDQGEYVFSCQQLLRPVDKKDQVFKSEWLKYYERPPFILNKYLLVDPANEKKKDSAYTAMGVIGVDSRKNFFLIDLVWDRLNLGERWLALRSLVTKHWPLMGVGYEKYGMQADDAYIKEKQDEARFHFHITPLGGQIAKHDRIRKLQPVFEVGRFFLPPSLIYKGRDLIRVLVDEEYDFFPFCVHVDILDMMARIEDPAMHVTAPLEIPDPGGYEAQPEPLDPIAGY